MKIKNEKNTKNLWASVGVFWNNYYKVFFGIIILVVSVFGGFFWYESLYGSTWSEEERAIYKKTKDAGINFKEDYFSKALEIVAERKTEYVKEYPELKDIFKPY